MLKNLNCNKERKLKMKNQIETIDITPTWASLIPALCAVIEDGTSEGRALAIEELMRLAKFADDFNAKNKKAA